MLSFNQVVMSLGTAARSEKRVEEQVILIPSAWHRMMTMALPHHGLPPCTPPGNSSSSQWSHPGCLAGWFITPLASLDSATCLWHRADPCFFHQEEYILEQHSPTIPVTPNLAKFLAAKYLQGLKVGFSSTQYFEIGCPASLLCQLKEINSMP